MWKWILGGLVAIVAVLAILGFVFRDTMALMAFRAAVEPDMAFAEAEPPAVPDYTLQAHWAALPDRDDNADYTPPGETSGQAGASVDVFFIHPTTYFDKSGWNAPMGDQVADDFIREFVLRGQASAYNGSARVFAPHYRQAQIFAFLALEDGGWDALELAYSDVETAFDTYLAEHNDGRPFIIAGHSQGALHARWLLERRISGTPLTSQLVAAYPIGYFMKQAELDETLPDIPVCGSAGQTGCLVTWNATGDGYRPAEPTDGMVCVNPLNWSNGNEVAGFEANLGALSLTEESLESGVADGQCRNGVLYVSEIRSTALDDQPFDMGTGNYHLLDYALYWKDIRENVAERIAAYQAG